MQKRDKNGLPLNYGPYRNGYYVGNDRKPSAPAQNAGSGAEQAAQICQVLLTAGGSAAGHTTHIPGAALPLEGSGAGGAVEALMA